MIVFYNDYTFFAAAIGFVCGFGMYSFSRSGSAAAFVGSLSIIGFDLITRLRNRDQETPLLAPKAGGHIWFIPVWIIGIIVTAIGSMMWLGWL